jgi:hypothetical protein
MSNKELQQQYIQVKKELESLQAKYWTTPKEDCTVELEFKIIDTFTLLKSINKQMYYGEG